MSKQAVRKLRLTSLRQQLEDDRPSKAAFTAWDAVQAARDDLDNRRKELESTGHFSALGIAEQLRPFRAQHAAALREQLTALKAAADPLVTQKQAMIDLPADATRLLTFWQSQSITQRNDALSRALAGRDPELAAVLAHPSNARYTGLTPNSLELLRKQFVQDEVNEENAPRLQALQGAAEEIVELLPTLEG